MSHTKYENFEVTVDGLQNGLNVSRRRIQLGRNHQNYEGVLSPDYDDDDDIVGDTNDRLFFGRQSENYAAPINFDGGGVQRQRPLDGATGRQQHGDDPIEISDDDDEYPVGGNIFSEQSSSTTLGWMPDGSRSSSTSYAHRNAAPRSSGSFADTSGPQSRWIPSGSDREEERCWLASNPDRHVFRRSPDWQRSHHRSRSPDVRRTMSPDARRTRSPDVCRTISPDVRRYRSPDVRRTRSPDVRQTRSPDVRRYRSPDVRRTRSPDVRRTRSPDVRKYRSPDVRQTRSPSVRRTRSPDVRKYRSPDVRRTRSPDVRQYRSPDVRRYRSPDVRRTRSPDARRTRSPDVRRTRSPDVRRYRSPDVRRTRSPDVRRYRSPDGHRSRHNSEDWKMQSSESSSEDEYNPNWSTRYSDKAVSSALRRLEEERLEAESFDDTAASASPEVPPVLSNRPPVLVQIQRNVSATRSPPNAAPALTIQYPKNDSSTQSTFREQLHPSNSPSITRAEYSSKSAGSNTSYLGNQPLLGTSNESEELASTHQQQFSMSDTSGGLSAFINAQSPSGLIAAASIHTGPFQKSLDNQNYTWQSDQWNNLTLNNHSTMPMNQSGSQFGGTTQPASHQPLVGQSDCRMAWATANWNQPPPQSKNRNQMSQLEQDFILNQIAARTAKTIGASSGSQQNPWMSEAGISTKNSSPILAKNCSSILAKNSSSISAKNSSSISAKNSSSIPAKNSSKISAANSSTIPAKNASQIPANNSSTIPAKNSSQIPAENSSQILPRNSSSPVKVADAGKSNTVLHPTYICLTCSSHFEFYLDATKHQKQPGPGYGHTGIKRALILPSKMLLQKKTSEVTIKQPTTAVSDKQIDNTPRIDNSKSPTKLDKSKEDATQTQAKKDAIQMQTEKDTTPTEVNKDTTTTQAKEDTIPTEVNKDTTQAKKDTIQTQSKLNSAKNIPSEGGGKTMPEKDTIQMQAEKDTTPTEVNKDTTTTQAKKDTIPTEVNKDTAVSEKQIGTTSKIHNSKSLAKLNKSKDDNIQMQAKKDAIKAEPKKDTLQLQAKRDTVQMKAKKRSARSKSTSNVMSKEQSSCHRVCYDSELYIYDNKRWDNIGEKLSAKYVRASETVKSRKLHAIDKKSVGTASIGTRKQQQGSGALAKESRQPRNRVPTCRIPGLTPTGQTSSLASAISEKGVKTEPLGIKKSR